jgi:1-acyl-sn-glycerol-3-phosphate acyltransferase
MPATAAIVTRIVNIRLVISANYAERLAPRQPQPHNAAMQPAPFFIPPLGDAVARRGNAFTRAIAIFAMRATGWRITGRFPDVPQFVVIVAPHTSNWDFFVGVMAMFAIGFRGTFLGKHTVFRWPAGVVMRWLGGVPVNRSSSHNVVQQTIDYFRSRPQMLLALSPEGTRRKLPAWRTGFWYVAKGANVPIVPAAFDYPAKTITIFPAMTPGDDIASDIETLRAHFDARMAKHPAQY